MIRISTVIPLYNAEKYIEKCLDSVLSQGLSSEEHEVIVVDDGSTDGSASIVRTKQQKNPRIRLISQQNQGISAARNTGLKAAHGEFIHFMDADDECCRGGYKWLVRSILDVHYADWVYFYSITVDKRANINKAAPIEKSLVLFQGKADDFIMRHGFPAFVWNILYRRDFLLKNNLYFRPFKMGEDTLFNVETLRANPAVVVTNANIYRYYVRQKSAVTQASKKHLRMVIEGFAQLHTIQDNYRRTDLPAYAPAYEKIKTGYRSQILTRVLSGAFSIRELKQIRDLLQDANVLFSPSCSRMDNMARLLMSHLWLLWFVSPLYRHMFLPLIKPWISRN